MDSHSALNAEVSEVKPEYVAPAMVSYTEEELISAMQGFGGSSSDTPPNIYY